MKHDLQPNLDNSSHSEHLTTNMKDTSGVDLSTLSLHDQQEVDSIHENFNEADLELDSFSEYIQPYPIHLSLSPQLSTISADSFILTKNEPQSMAVKVARDSQLSSATTEEDIQTHRISFKKSDSFSSFHPQESMYSSQEASKTSLVTKESSAASMLIVMNDPSTEVDNGELLSNESILKDLPNSRQASSIIDDSHSRQSTQSCDFIVEANTAPPKPRFAVEQPPSDQALVDTSSQPKSILKRVSKHTPVFLQLSRRASDAIQDANDAIKLLADYSKTSFNTSRVNIEDNNANDRETDTDSVLEVVLNIERSLEVLCAPDHHLEPLPEITHPGSAYHSNSDSEYEDLELVLPKKSARGKYIRSSSAYSHTSHKSLKRASVDDISEGWDESTRVLHSLIPDSIFGSDDSDFIRPISKSGKPSSLSRLPILSKPKRINSAVKRILLASRPPTRKSLREKFSLRSPPTSNPQLSSPVAHPQPSYAGHQNQSQSYDHHDDSRGVRGTARTLLALAKFTTSQKTLHPPLIHYSLPQLSAKSSPGKERFSDIKSPYAQKPKPSLLPQSTSKQGFSSESNGLSHVRGLQSQYAQQRQEQGQSQSQRGLPQGSPHQYYQASRYIQPSPQYQQPSPQYQKSLPQYHQPSPQQQRPSPQYEQLNAISMHQVNQTRNAGYGDQGQSAKISRGLPPLYPPHVQTQGYTQPVQMARNYNQTQIAPRPPQLQMQMPPKHQYQQQQQQLSNYPHSPQRFYSPSHPSPSIQPPHSPTHHSLIQHRILNLPEMTYGIQQQPKHFPMAKNLMDRYGESAGYDQRSVLARSAYYGNQNQNQNQNGGSMSGGGGRSYEYGRQQVRYFQDAQNQR